MNCITPRHDHISLTSFIKVNFAYYIEGCTFNVHGLGNSIIWENVSPFNEKWGVLLTQGQWVKSWLRGSELLQKLNVTSGNTWINWCALTHTHYNTDIVPEYSQYWKGLQSQVVKVLFYPSGGNNWIQSQKHGKWLFSPFKMQLSLGQVLAWLYRLNIAQRLDVSISEPMVNS